MIIKKPSDRDDLLQSPQERDLKVVEFKVKAAFIASDFEREQKDPEEVALVVAWEEGTITGSARFAFEEIQLSQAYEASPRKVFGGVTRFINDNRTGRQIQVLLLKDVLAANPPA